MRFSLQSKRVLTLVVVVGTVALTIVLYGKYSLYANNVTEDILNEQNNSQNSFIGRLYSVKLPPNFTYLIGKEMIFQQQTKNGKVPQSSTRQLA